MNPSKAVSRDSLSFGRNQRRPRRPRAGRQLLERYDRAHPFCFSSPSRTLLALGPHAALPALPAAEAARCASLLLSDLQRSGLEGGAVVGAVPFDPQHPCRLLLPGRLLVAEPISSRTRTRSLPPTLGSVQAEFTPSAAGYCDAVGEALQRIARAGLRKVVLSRSLSLTPSAELDLAHLARRLILQNPSCYGFALHMAGDLDRDEELTEAGVPRTLFGASPELLLSKTGQMVTSNPLAGSAARSHNPTEDRERGRRLLASAKDRYEHQLVVDHIEERLRPHCHQLHVPQEPSLLSTPTMWHLSTRITGKLRQPALSSLQLALQLHPTPAVCGVPVRLAAQTIRELEGFERGFFGGLVGWCDAQGDGEWAVCIRCAEGTSGQLKLFAGAGVVSGSQPECEHRETQAKLRTLLNAIGLDDRITDSRGGEA